MKKKPKISIIVPIYNVEKYLPKCIESILNQSFKNFELILVNDGSPDDCQKICLSYKETDKRIKIINKENQGLLSARKSGLENSNGEYISFVDADDWVDYDFLSSFNKLIELYKPDIIVSGFYRAFEGKNEKILPINNIGFYSNNSIKEIKNKMLKTDVFFQHGISTYVWNKLYKRDILKDILYNVPNDITMGEDAAITYAYMSKISNLVITHSCNYFYRQRPSSMVKAIQNTSLEIKHLTNLINFLSKYNNSEKYKNDLIYYLYSQSLIRFGGIISNKEELNPFQGLLRNHKVLLYSSGTFGQRLISFNKRYNFFRLVSWIDIDHKESIDLGLNVLSPYKLKVKDFDSILIASIDKNKTSKILNFLSLYGFDESKFRPIIIEKKFIIKYLNYIGYSLDILK